MIGLEVSSARPDGAEAVDEGVREGMIDAAQAGFAESQARVPEATGELKASGELVRGETTVTFQYTAEHAQFVEAGTPPHWPPIEPLKEWANIVLGDPNAAYGVQQKIAEAGTPARPFAKPGFEVMSRELRRRGLSPNIEGKL